MLCYSVLRVSRTITSIYTRSVFSKAQYSTLSHKMGKKKNTPPLEEHLVLPTHPSRLDSVESDHAATVDTHTHLLSTFEAYRATYKPGKHETIWDFVKAMYHGRRVEAIVDVWCEAPVRRAQWKELADSALDEEQRERNWSGIEYWFVMGVLQVLSQMSQC